MRVLQAPSPQAAASFFCSKCKIQFSSDESLQKHFAESPPGSHMKCRTCGMAFEGLASWATVSTPEPEPCLGGAVETDEGRSIRRGARPLEDLRPVLVLVRPLLLL